jgi:hypothetical protein
MDDTQHNFAKKLAPRGSVSVMEHAGFKARLMMARRLEGEGLHGLPPGLPVPVFPIAALPAAPEGWGRAAGTYVCPVSASWGLWFDWTMNDPLNTAVLPSVKGMNPITGQKINTIDLEQYKDKCPIHGCDLSHERYCEECGYKLPPQNYVCAPNRLWFDGTRQPDGSVRQFFFTEEDERDVASAVIGKENTVPAFGFAFFKPKNPIVSAPTRSRGVVNCSAFSMDEEEITYGGLVLDSCAYDAPMTKSIATGAMSSYGTSSESSSSGNISNSSMSMEKYSANDIKVLRGADARAKRPEMYARKGAAEEVKDVKKAVSVGAGARIDQTLLQDTLDMKDWNEEASGIIRLYFVFEPQFTKMLREGGIKDIVGNKVGYLDGVEVG